MCGWSLGSLSESHYWVVDGIKNENGNTLIHCNGDGQEVATDGII